MWLLLIGTFVVVFVGMVAIGLLGALSLMNDDDD